MAALVLLPACSSGDSGKPAPASTVATTTTSTRPPTTTSTTIVGEVTVRGVVGQTLASARVVVLTQPVSGFVNIAFSTETEVVRAGGAKAAMADIATGATIEATGRPSTAGTLVARRVVLL